MMLVTEAQNDRVTVIPMGLVGILASTSCFNPFTLLSLGYTGELTERGLEIAPRDGSSLKPLQRDAAALLAEQDPRHHGQCAGREGRSQQRKGGNDR